MAVSSNGERVADQMEGTIVLKLFEEKKLMPRLDERWMLLGSSVVAYFDSELALLVVDCDYQMSHQYDLDWLPEPRRITETHRVTVNAD